MSEKVKHKFNSIYFHLKGQFLDRDPKFLSVNSESCIFKLINQEKDVRFRFLILADLVDKGVLICTSKKLRKKMEEKVTLQLFPKKLQRNHRRGDLVKVMDNAEKL
jgi:hypothetical protein